VESWGVRRPAPSFSFDVYDLVFPLSSPPLPFLEREEAANPPTSFQDVPLLGWAPFSVTLARQCGLLREARRPRATLYGCLALVVLQ
jgi:hypothetical protein